MRHCFKAASAAVLVASWATLLGAPAHAGSRIKDIVDIEGIRSNHLVGYGLVVGLNGTGDTVRNCPQLLESMNSMMDRLQTNIRSGQLNSKNAAAVMVTAELPPNAIPGSTLDIKVSSMCDAKSLQGGSLMVTPLQGADGNVYAVGQGTVETGAVSAGGASGSSITRGVPTSGHVASGAQVELETNFDINKMAFLRLDLHNPDLTTAKRIAAAIVAQYPGCAVAENSTDVAVRPPEGMKMMDFLVQIEPLAVDVDEPAKVVIDEDNGIVVMGESVRISRVAIAQGNLTIKVDEQPGVSQPAPFSQGQTATVPNSNVNVDEEKGKKLIELGGGSSLSDLVKGLNALGVTPRDMIQILQAIKAAGALQADIQVM
jgi:flagellar P-ring protein precursor FlgI